MCVCVCVYVYIYIYIYIYIYNQMIIKQQANYANVTVLPVYLVSKFTHSFSFTPSSELYEWTNVGNMNDVISRGGLSH